MINPNHVNHLIENGFTQDQIKQFIADGIITSLDPSEATKKYFRCDNKTGGLEFNFTPTFAQIRLDDPAAIQKPGEKTPKYLSSARAIDTDCTWIPEGVKVITEGIKDALAFTYHGDIPTGAVAGIDHIQKALPKNCGHTVIFDADGWNNIRVLQSLIRAGIHCGGGIVLLPAVDGDNKAGGCEYFKSGKTAKDYKNLIASALQPLDFISYYIDTTESEIIDKNSAIDWAAKIGKLYGEYYGFASSRAKEAIKDLMNNDSIKSFKISIKTIYEESCNTKTTSSERSQCLGDLEETDPIIWNHDYFLANIKCFKSAGREPEAYCELVINNTKKTIKITDKYVKTWIINNYTVNKNKNIGGDNLKTCIHKIESTILCNNEYPTYEVVKKNIVKYEDNYYLALGDIDNTIIVYNADGWSVANGEIPIKFISSGQKSLPVPLRGGSMKRIWDFANITGETNQVAALACIVKALIPGGADPILALSGYAGSGKSTAADYLTKILQPSPHSALMSKMPKAEDLELLFKNNRILAIDNLSHISQQVSDNLCSIATGSAIGKRKLYTDDDCNISYSQGITIITSIGQVITQSDLLERSIRINLDKIKSGESSGDQQEEFDRYHGQLLANVLDLAVASLKHKKELTKETTPRYSRMVELSIIAEAIEKELHYPQGSYKQHFDHSAIEANEIASDSSPTASVLVDWIENQQMWTGTMSSLLNILVTKAKDRAKLLPRTSNSLGSELKKIEHALISKNITIEKTRDTNNRLVTITYNQISQSKDQLDLKVHVSDDF